MSHAVRLTGEIASVPTFQQCPPTPADQRFNAGDPHEGRLSWNHFGTELWEDDRG